MKEDVLYGGYTLAGLSTNTECACCKKVFGRTPEWYWKYSGKYVCSYHCMRALEKADPKSVYNMKIFYKNYEQLDQLADKKNTTPLMEMEKLKILEEFRAGATVAELERRFRRSTKTIGRVIAEAGEKVRSLKMTEEDKARIRELRAQGLTSYQIAEAMGIAQSTALRYCRGTE